MRNQLPTSRLSLIWMIWTHRPASPDLVYFPRKFPRSGPSFILLYTIPILRLGSFMQEKALRVLFSPLRAMRYKASMISMTHWELWQQEGKQFSQLDNLNTLQHARTTLHRIPHRHPENRLLKQPELDELLRVRPCHQRGVSSYPPTIPCLH